ncbi:MAG: hopanoid biosynthesis-associated RND transporter HpnN, partial [Rhizobiales bacterium]|nr:hopanoid biosynthesis-associated RND transporter HpnN [Hyphomicrobiales bacterium]
MLRSLIARIVAFATARSFLVAAVYAVVSIGSAVYAVQNFAINTDINQLISQNLSWRQRDLALEAAFPARQEFILAVVDAKTPEQVTQATDELLQRLRETPNVFNSVRQRGGGP